MKNLLRNLVAKLARAMHHGRDIFVSYKSYSFAFIVLFSFGCGVGFYVGRDSGIVLPTHQEIAELDQKSAIVSGITPSVITQNVTDDELSSGVTRAEQLESNKALVLEQIDADRPKEKSVQIKNGDTLVTLLMGEGVDRQVAHNVVCSLKEHCNPRRLKPGQTVTLAMKPGEDEDKPELLKVSLKMDDRREVHASRNEGSNFNVWLEEKELIKELAMARGEIDGSFFTSTTNVGVPAYVVVDVIRALAHRLDLQRDLRKGDKFEIAYERFVDTEGKAMGSPKAMYVSLESRGKPIILYRHTDKHGHADFFTHDGQHIKRGFMRTPVDGARLSSKFGMRKHPISGYRKMHRGVDFAAPRGTPIYAAGDGKVVKMGWVGGYGRYIKIKHNSEYCTAYGHMHRFAKGLKIGARVRQGQKIGAVGSTGHATGPHLHYEVHRHGKQINPKLVKMVGGNKLKGRDLNYFRACKQNFDVHLAAVRTDEDQKQKFITVKLSEPEIGTQLADASLSMEKTAEADEPSLPAKRALRSQKNAARNVVPKSSPRKV